MARWLPVRHHHYRYGHQPTPRRAKKMSETARENFDCRPFRLAPNGVSVTDRRDKSWEKDIFNILFVISTGYEETHPRRRPHIQVNWLGANT